jgi:hypothetical protein
MQDKVKHQWPILVAASVAILAAPLGASTIDASADTNIVLHTGDELVFEIDIQNYRTEAPIYDAPAMPSNLDFSLVTDPTVSPVKFAAGIESISGGDPEALGGVLSFQPGIFQSAYYSGPISTLSGEFGFSGRDASSLFASSLALLYIEDLGGDVTLGLAPYVLPGDLYASAGGGEISVGAYTDSAIVVSTSDNPVPEPDSIWLMLGGGAGLCFAALFLRRWETRRARRIQ